jgi:putative transposase
VSDVSASSGYFIAWKLCTNMKAADVTDTREQALQTSGCAQGHVVHMPHLLSKLPMIAPRVRDSPGDRSNHIAAERVEWLDGKGMKHSRGGHCHPQTQRKIPSH